MVKLLALIFLTPLILFSGIVNEGLQTLGEKTEEEQKKIIESSRVELKPQGVIAFTKNIPDQEKINLIVHELVKAHPSISFSKNEITSFFNQLPKERQQSFLIELIGSTGIQFTKDQVDTYFEGLSETEKATFYKEHIASYTDPKLLTNEEKRKLILAFATSSDKKTQETLFDTLDTTDQIEFLIELLGRFEEEEQQNYVNKLKTSKYYSDHLINPSESRCATASSLADPAYAGTIPFIDALNATHIPNFYNSAPKNSLINREHFHDFNTFEQASLFIEPYGYYSQFDQGKDRLNFNLYTIGISIGGEYTFLERLTLGLGAAYSFSELHFKKDEELAKLNTFYLGPYLGYLFPRGSLSLTLLGAMNFIHTERQTHLFPDKITKSKKATSNYNSWDINSRLEGVFFQPLGEDFYLNPSARIDYIHVFQGKNIETLDKKTSLHVKSLYESFLQVRLGLELKREVYKKNLGFIIPSLLCGWTHFAPITKNGYHYYFEECEETYQGKSGLGSWSAFSYGAALTFIHKRGFHLSLEYELSMGSDLTEHKGVIRTSMSW